MQPVAAATGAEARVPGHSWAHSRKPWEHLPPWLEAPRRQPPLRFIPVIEYHHLLPTAEIRKRAAFAANPYIVPVETFAHQLTQLQRAGYNTIDTVDLQRYYHGSAALPAHPILITFDDGYDSFYQYAFPLLKEHKMKATLFVIVASIPEHPTPFTPLKMGHVSWPGLREMVDSSWVDVQNHTYDMHALAPSGSSQLVAAPPDQARQDLLHAKQMLEGRLGRPVVSVAYPHGHYNADVAKIVRDTGHTFGFGGPGHRLLDDPLVLQRKVIEPTSKL